MRVESGLTLVTVGASEALLALAAELAPGLAPAAAVRSTHIRRNVALSSRCAVGCHGDSAAVNHCREKQNSLDGETADEACLNKQLFHVTNMQLVSSKQ